MSRRTHLTPPVAVLLLTVLWAEPALAAVSVTRAEVSGSRLRIEGTAAASRDIRVDGVVMGRSDAAGAFEVRRDGYTPPADCTVGLDDASGTVTEARLAGCTVSGSPAPPPAPADTTAPSAPADLTATVVGSTVSLGWAASTDDRGVAGYTVTRNGVVRTTTSGTSFSDTGLAAGTYTYVVTASDAAGNTSGPSNSASAAVQEPEGLTFLTPSALPDATLGQAYLASVVASDPPGPSVFDFKVVSGRVPAGTRFLENTLETRPEARVSGTPSARGTYSFTVEVEDGTGATARRTFTVRVL